MLRLLFRSISLGCCLVAFCPVLRAADAPPAASGGRLSPAPGAADVCPDTPLRLTFTSPPKLGSAGIIRIVDATSQVLVDSVDVGTAQTKTIGGMAGLNYYPVFITGNEAVIYPRNHALAYGKTYNVTIEPGAFTDSAGKALAGPAAWSFSTRAAGPAAGTTRLTVAVDGTGDFCTVQGAVDFVPAGNTTPTTIFIRRGVYSEIVYVAGKHALTFLGEDRKKTVIAYPNNARFNPANRNLFTVVRCNDFTLSNLTLWNTTPQGGTQAEALYLNGNATSRAIVTGVDLDSFQDTFHVNGQTYFKDCCIRGDVDFMWGNGPCFLEDCQCVSVRAKAYYTQIRSTAATHGYVYSRCTFSGAPEVTGMALARIDGSVYPNSEVVLLDCVLTGAVGPVGWVLTGNPAAPNIHYWEFNSRDAAGQPVDVSGRLPISRQLKLPDDAELIANYRNPVWVLGNAWDPRKAPIFAALATAPAASPASTPIVSGDATPVTPPGPSAELRKDLEYGRAGAVSLKLDASVPAGAGPFPIAILIHGGGWSGGDKGGSTRPGDSADITPWFGPLTQANFTWFSINYRLAPANRWPAALDDVQTAIRWVKAHAAEFKGDPKRIVLFGHSAGGHLACLAALVANDDTRVQAVVGCAPVTDLEADSRTRGGLSSSLQNLFGLPKDINDASLKVLRELSPINHITAASPPFLLLQGEVDKTVPPPQTLAFEAKLQATGIPVELITIKGAPHSLVAWEKTDPAWPSALLAWLAKTVGE